MLYHTFYHYNKSLLQLKLSINMQGQTELSLDSKDQQQNFHLDEQNHLKDFSSVQRLVKLPNLRKVLDNENVFPPVEKELITTDIVSPQLKQIMIKLRQTLKTQFSVFEDPKHFNFNFPESKFPSVEKGTRNQITYEQKNIVQEQDTFKDKLSLQQIKQIRQKGQFKVRSNIEYITLPYVWKINDVLFRGRQNIQLSWRVNIAKAFGTLNNALSMFREQIPKQLNKIKDIPMRLFSLLFGRKQMNRTHRFNYDYEVAKDFWDEVMSKHYAKSKQWGSDLWEYFDTGYKSEDFITIQKLKQGDGLSYQKKIYQRKLLQQTQSRQKYSGRVTEKTKKKNAILAIADQFERSWIKNKNKIFAQVSSQCTISLQSNQKSGDEQQQLIVNKQKENEDQILQKFNEKKFENYTAYLEKSLPKANVPQGVIEAIVTILTLMQINTKKQIKFNAKKHQNKESVYKKVRQQHKIKQYDPVWYNSQTNRVYQPIQKELNQEYYYKYIDCDLIKRLNMRQRQVYDLWLEYRASYSARIQAKKKELPQNEQPSRTFYSTYHLLPPYKVTKHRDEVNTWYEMTKEGKIQVTTQTNFWKLSLYCMRVKSWTINCVVFLVYSCWKGTFGLRCLWGTSEFKYNQSINCSTGQIYNQYRKPVLRVFQDVLSGITESRNHFQGLPDRGLFGKNFSRLFNYIECYVFRLLFVGILLTLILYPMAIVFSSILSGLLIMTVWAWMPITLILTYLFNTFVFQFQTGCRTYAFIIRAAPIFTIVINLVWDVLKIILICIWLTVCAPIAGFFICLFAALSKGLRTLTDILMLFLIRKLGRTPSKNTTIARKISGPGMSKQYYMSINQEDVYILVQSQLEQIFMTQYNRIFNQKVQKPITRFNKAMQLLINPLQNNQFNLYQNNNQHKNIIFKSVSELKKRYNTLYRNYVNRYPSRPHNTRFTQDQIDSYFDNTVSIVKNFVEKKQIKSWIFEDFHILEEYEELTRKIWMRVFNCGEQIFEPLEKIDLRFKLEDMYKNDYQNSYGVSVNVNEEMKKNVNKVMKALEGQVELSHRKANITAFKHSLMNKQLAGFTLRQLFNLMQLNTDGRVYLSLEVPRFLFFANLPIKEVIKRDACEYQMRKEDLKKKQNQ